MDTIQKQTTLKNSYSLYKNIIWNMLLTIKITEPKKSSPMQNVP